MTFHGGRGRGRRKPGFGSDDDAPDLPPPDPVEEQKRAKEICFTQLAAQPRTRLELKNAMLRKGIEEELAELVLGKFDKAGLIDDAAFAEIWVRSRHTYNGLGRRALAMELKRKGVADDLVTEAVAAVDDEAEQDRARELVRKKLRGMTGVDETAKIRRLVGALARKGYAGGMAYQVVREELRAAGEDAALLDDALPE
jgi:regulatory protein